MPLDRRRLRGTNEPKETITELGEILRRLLRLARRREILLRRLLDIADGVADLLWAVVMLPDFQLVR